MRQHKNLTGVMESETIQKNEASSKSHTSRRHFFSYFVIATLTMAAILTSCGGGGIGGSSYKIKITTEKGYISFYLSGSGVATIDWGDGSEKVSLTLNEERSVTFEHSYPNASIRTITINGDKITELTCNDITSLDVSKNTMLSKLYVYNSQLTSLDVSKNIALTSLSLWGNAQLTSLDVSKNTALIGLGVNSSPLVSLDVSKNKALTNLGLVGCTLTSLDVSKNTALTSLTLNNNTQLASLDVSKNTALTYLDCSINQFTSLYVSKNTALTNLNCSSNKFTSLDVSKNTALTNLNCSSNKFTSLDVSKNTALTDLNCSRNQITNLDVSKNNTVLRVLDCSINQLMISALNVLFEALPVYEQYSTSGGGEYRLQHIDIRGNPGAKDCDPRILDKKKWSYYR